MAANQDYTEDMAQGDFSNESYGDYVKQDQQSAQDGAAATGANGQDQVGQDETMAEEANGDGHHGESHSDHMDASGKDEDRYEHMSLLSLVFIWDYCVIFVFSPRESGE